MLTGVDPLALSIHQGDDALYYYAISPQMNSILYGSTPVIRLVGQYEDLLEVITCVFISVKLFFFVILIPCIDILSYLYSVAVIR